jgi:hypothetical protein
VLVTRSTRLNDERIILPGANDEKGHGAVHAPAAGGDDAAGAVTVSRYDFVIQFVWKEKPLGGPDDKQSPGEKTPALAAGGSAPGNR